MNPVNRIIKHARLRKTALIMVTLLVPLVLLELFCRIYYPFHYDNKFTRKEHGDVVRYDPLLGWSGVPEGTGWADFENNSVLIENNKLGFRDIEHDGPNTKAAIVFLGSSFTWGYEVAFDEMFVNLLRNKLNNYEIFNLSNICYGTDQKYLMFKNWQDEYQGQIKLAILMFTERDVQRNRPAAYTDCNRAKPYFEIVQDKPVLRGMPVPKTPIKQHDKQLTEKNRWKERIKNIIFKSSLLHTIYVRYAYIRVTYFEPDTTAADNSVPYRETEKDLALAYKILEQLKWSAEERGAEFVVFLIASSEEIQDQADSPPYQKKIIEHCPELGISCVDLAPAFKNTWRRTYYPENGHWNAYGHKVAAETIYHVLTNDGELNLRSP